MVWNPVTGGRLHTLPHQDYVRSVSFSPDGTKLLSGAYDNTAKIWDMTMNDALLHTLSEKSYVRAVTFSPDGITFALG